MNRYFLLLLLFISPTIFAHSTKGTMCLDRNLAKPFEEKTNRLYLKINDSEKIYFIRPYIGPRIIATNLDLELDHSVKVYFDDQVVVSWKVNFTKLDTTGINIWRSGGAWHADPIDPQKCEANTQTH
jgi:hypothetical protein